MEEDGVYLLYKEKLIDRHVMSNTLKAGPKIFPTQLNPQPGRIKHLASKILKCIHQACIAIKVMLKK
jgi:hypothetical protein